MLCLSLVPGVWMQKCGVPRRVPPPPPSLFFPLVFAHGLSQQSERLEAVSQHSIALPLDFPIHFTRVTIYINNLNWSVLSFCFLWGLATLPNESGVFFIRNEHNCINLVEGKDYLSIKRTITRRVIECTSVLSIRSNCKRRRAISPKSSITSW